MPQLMAEAQALPLAADPVTGDDRDGDGLPADLGNGGHAVEPLRSVHADHVKAVLLERVDHLPKWIASQIPFGTQRFRGQLHVVETADRVCL